MQSDLLQTSNDQAGESGGRAWKLTRNCSMAPATLCTNLGLLAAVNGAVAAGFCSLGYPVVGLFCLGEALALAMALIVYARHSCDGETIELVDGALRVRSVSGRVCRHYSFEPHWTRLEHSGGGAVLELCNGRRRVRVGRHVTSQQRRVFVSQLQPLLARGLH